MCISSKPRTQHTAPSTVFQRTPIYTWVHETKDSSNTDGCVSLALTMRITIIIIKKEVEIKSLFSRTFEKKFLMCKEKKIKRDY